MENWPLGYTGPCPRAPHRSASSSQSCAVDGWSQGQIMALQASVMTPVSPASAPRSPNPRWLLQTTSSLQYCKWRELRCSKNLHKTMSPALTIQVPFVLSDTESYPNYSSLCTKAACYIFPSVKGTWIFLDEQHQQCQTIPLVGKYCLISEEKGLPLTDQDSFM